MTAGDTTTERLVEVWESTIPGTTWVTITDRRGADRSVKVPGGGRLRIRTVDREYTEDSILKEESNPFTNGTLRKVDGGTMTPEQEIAAGYFTEPAMLHLLAKKDMEFLDAIDQLPERGVRMLKSYITDHRTSANVEQAATVDQVIEEKFTIQAVMPSTAEILERGE